MIGLIGIVCVIFKIVFMVNIDIRNEIIWLFVELFWIVCEKMSMYWFDEFWVQWIYSVGCFKFDIKQKFNKKNLNVDIIVEQRQSKDIVKEIIKEDFYCELVELRYDVWVGLVFKYFIGLFFVWI